MWEKLRERRLAVLASLLIVWLLLALLSWASNVQFEVGYAVRHGSTFFVLSTHPMPFQGIPEGHDWITSVDADAHRGYTPIHNERVCVVTLSIDFLGNTIKSFLGLPQGGNFYNQFVFSCP